MSQPSAEDFDAVHAGVMETTRGRWFLHEYSRRYRNADTTLLLTAIKRMESALDIQNAIPAASHEPPRLADQSAPPRSSSFEAVPFAHQLYELRDAIRLTKNSLPAVGKGHNALTHPDFSRIAKGISVIAARMRWIAGQVPEAQKRAIATVHDDLDKLVEGASMIAALLAEIETQLDGLVETAQALAEAEVLAATEPPSISRPAAEPVSAAPPEPVREAPVAAAAMEITPPAPDVIADDARPQATTIETPVEIRFEMTAEITAQAPAERSVAPVPQDTRWLHALAPQIAGRAPHDALIDVPVNFELASEPHPMIAMPNPVWREHPGAIPAPAPESPAQTPAQIVPQAEPVKAPDIAFELVQQLIQETVVEKITETVKETIQQTIVAVLPEKVAAPTPAPHITAPSWSRDEPREDPAAFAFDPFSHGLQWEPQLVLPAQAPEEVKPVQSQPVQSVLPARPEPIAHEQPKTSNGAIKAAVTPPPIQIAPIQIAKPSSPLAPIMALSDEEKIALFS